MKRCIQKVLKISFFVAWITVIIIGYAEFVYFKTYISKSLVKGYRYLGEVGNRKIYAVAGYFKDENNQIFTIKVDDELIYTEIDYNKDGRADNIIHFEKGRDFYSSHYDPSSGILFQRDIEYYINDLHQLTVFDARLNGEFVSRIKYLDKEKKSFKEAKKIMEIFVNNKWTELKKENGSYGFYEEGTFIPIDYKKGQWKILEAEK